VDGAPVAIRGSQHEEPTTASGALARCAPPGVGATITPRNTGAPILLVQPNF
jgi:hypothetical protein